MWLSWQPVVLWCSTASYIGWEHRLEVTGVVQPLRELWLSAWPWQRNRKYVGNQRGPQRVVESWPGLPHWPQQRNPRPPISAMPSWKRMCWSGSFSTQCGIIPHVSVWLVIGLLCWKRMCGNTTRPLLREEQPTSFMELKSTFSQWILFRLRTHSQHCDVNTSTKTTTNHYCY